ncbi:MAG TPA: hypothetical protein VF459_04270 [Caulobacteraceae bacterium]
MRRIGIAGLLLGTAALIGGAALARPAHHPAGPAAATALHISSHLAEAAKVAVDGGKAVTAPGYGSTVVTLGAGHHVLKVTSAEGATYQGTLDLKPGDLMTWHGKGYWCVNLLETSLEPYSKDECQEDVTDAG